VSDDEWLAERKRRMAELTTQAEADLAGSRRHREPPADAGPVVVRSRRGHWYTNVLAVAILLLVSWLLISSALTLARFTGNSLDDARRRGTATVEQCRRRGPITLLHGFGFYNECTVSIAWNSGYPSRVVISKPGFFAGAKPGDTFEIGENTGSRGRVGYSRAALPERTWITVVAGVIDVVGALLLLTVFFYVWRSARDLLRRRD
jgi:hypothetical protein